MPRGRIKVGDHVEYLSVLDEDGHLDSGLAPDIPDELLREMHRVMLLGRRFDERLMSLQRQGRLGTFAPVKGQEASQIGTAAALRKSDWVVPSYREYSVAIWRGTPLDGLFLHTAGYNEGGAIPEDRFDLPIAVPVGTQPLHAVGLGYSIKFRGEDKVVATYFGDGATSQGDFHEALNFAGVFGTPVVFICQNNQWAISVPRNKQTSSRTLAQKAIAYDIPAIQVDGNDVLAVYAATAEAVERARTESRPTMIECVTYRLEVHTTADDPTRYRDEDEVKAWEKRDPLPRIQRYLKERDLLSDDDIEALEDAIKAEITDAWKRTESRIEKLTDPSVMFDHLYAEMPPYLAAQRAEFEREWSEKKGSDDE